MPTVCDNLFLLLLGVNFNNKGEPYWITTNKHLSMNFFIVIIRYMLMVTTRLRKSSHLQKLQRIENNLQNYFKPSTTTTTSGYVISNIDTIYNFLNDLLVI